jgi:hypothetical protein
MRAFFGRLSCAIAAVALLTVGVTPSSAAVVQIGSFSSSSGDYSYSGGNLTGTTTGVWTFDPVFAATFGVTTLPIPGATLEVDASATGPVVCAGPFCSQPMDGFIEILDAANVLILRVDFTGAFLAGVLGDITVDLTGSTALLTDIKYTSAYFNDADLIYPNDLTNPAAFTFTMNPIDPTLALSGTDFADFTGPDTGNFSGSTELELVPEPAMLTLFGLGLSGAGILARRRRQANNK